MIVDAIFIVLSIFGLMATGMILTKIGWIDESGARLISRLVVNVALPGLILNNMLTDFTRESLIRDAAGILLPYITMAITLLIGYALSLLARIPRNRRGVFVSMFGFSNSVFIGVPVSVALFGEGVTPYALMYYIVNTSLFWTVGNRLMARDGGRQGRFDLKKMLPAPLAVFLLSVAMILMGLTLPGFLLRTAGYLGNMVTPLSLIYTGYVLMGMIGRGRLRWEKGYALTLAGRFVVAPGLVILMGRFFDMPDLMRGALIMQAAMPVMTQTTIVAGNNGADVEYAAGGLALTTLCSLAAIPAYMALIQRII